MPTSPEPPVTYPRHMSRFIVRALAALTAALLVSVGLLAGPNQAAACACGAVISDATVHGETSIIAWNGLQQSIDMRMLIDRSTDNAAWIMPTPAPADITLGTTTGFSLLADQIAPKVTVKRVFRPTLAGLFGAGSDTAGEPESTGAYVLRTTEVGPFTVVTLTGSDGEAVNTWLHENGYGTRDDLVPTFGQYLAKGWVLQAVKLTARTPGAPFQGSLPSLRMTFATDEPVYPIELSSHATTYQDVRVYLLSPQPLVVAQQAGDFSDLELLYSGAIGPDLVDVPLLSGERVHLTAFEATLDPDDILRDITFTADPNLPDFQRERIIYDNVAEGLVSVLILGLLLASPLLVIALVVRRVTARPIH